MPRISGIDIPGEKKIKVGLTYLFGVGITTALKALTAVNINPEARGKDLSEEELGRVADYLDKNMVVEGPLRRQIAANIQRLKDIGCYRGLRHRKGLPVRGQRTRSNSRTRKGPRKTVAGKKGVKAAV